MLETTKNDKPVTGSALRVSRVVPDAVLPTRAHPGDAGLDLYALEDFLIRAGQGLVARTGIALALPAGHVGMVADRSSMAKAGIKTAGGIIDSGYRGEIHIVLRNLTSEDFKVERGHRIAQLLILPVVSPPVLEVESVALDSTARGSKGFGSSGK